MWEKVKHWLIRMSLKHLLAQKTFANSCFICKSALWFRGGFSSNYVNLLHFFLNSKGSCKNKVSVSGPIESGHKDGAETSREIKDLKL